MSIGEKIKVARKERKMTQRQLAEKSGLIETTIRKYEAGTQTPKLNNLQKIAAALDCPVGDLFTFDDPPVPASVFNDWLASIGYDVKLHDIEAEYGGGQRLFIRERETWDDSGLMTFSEFDALRDKIISFTRFQVAELFNAHKASTTKKEV
ncbi:MAG: helix-turn-helix domain-containing protein [Oscillospiraceae bacterium]|nr:helix-turn-helix domain-containing protein [Oscillospiraceae bacterium]